MDTDRAPSSPKTPTSRHGIEWLTTEQAANYLCTRPKTLEYWRHTGGSPKYAKLGRQVRYRRDWLDEWLEARAVTSTAESKHLGMV